MTSINELPEDANQLLPEKWSDWKLAELVGEGSFASVYKAVRSDEAGTSCSAIKILQVPKGEKTDQCIDEIKTMLSLKGHPHIVGIEDYATVPREDGTLILIRMELLTPLDRAAAAGDIGEEETVKLGIELCSALEHCQKKKILHMDIKPSNIFVTDEGYYKLGDFGISRSRERLSGGMPQEFSPNFMGPELYHMLTGGNAGEPADGHALGEQYDLYSLGLVLYWLRNRRRVPFLPEKLPSPKDRKEAFLRRIGGEALPAPSDASAGLSKVIMKACAYRPEDRYRSPAEMRAALEKLRDGKEEPKPKRKRTLLIMLAAAAVLTAGLVYALTRPDSGGGSGPDHTETASAAVTETGGQETPDAGSVIASGTCGENLTWELAGQVLRIRGTGEMDSYPYNGAPWYDQRETIRKVVVEEGVTAIGNYAFFECGTLTEAELPQSLRRIREMAFGYCYILPKLTVPEGVEAIDGNIVYRCNQLTEISLPGTLKLIGDSFPGECPRLKTIILGEGCTAYRLQDGVLFDAEMEKLICRPAARSELSYTVPDSVRTITGSAFENNKDLIEITIPDSVTTIEISAFYGCEQLRNLTIPDSVTSLGRFALYECSELKTVRLPPRITTIAQQAIYHCSSLREIEIPEGVTSIDTAAFEGCLNLEAAHIPGSVRSISQSAFNQCPSLTIYCPEGSYAWEYAGEHGIPRVAE